MSAANLVPPPCFSCAAPPPRGSAAFLDGPRLWSSLPRRPGGSFNGSRARTPAGLSSSVSVARRRRRWQGARGGKLVVRAYSSALEVITASAWDNSVLQSDLPVVVEFWASWCGPCRMVHRLLDEIAREYTGRVKLCMLNTDDHPQVASLNDVDRVPTVLLFKNGKKLKSITGTLPKSVYVEAIEQLLSH